MSLRGTFRMTRDGEREIVVVRQFAVPRSAVFDGFTQSELLKQWMFGPEGWSMPVCELDLRPGGRIRYEWRHEDGREMGMSGTFRDIKRPLRMIHTELFDEDWTGGEVIAATTFEEENGITTATMRLTYPDAAACTRVLDSGMEDGIALGYDRLETLLASAVANQDKRAPEKPIEDFV